MFSLFSKSKTGKTRRKESESKVSMASRLVASSGQTSTVVEGEAVIMDSRSGQYFSLSQVGARAWDLVTQPQILSQVRDTILNEYDVDSERCEEDLLRLFEELAEEGLVQIVDSGRDSV